MRRARRGSRLEASPGWRRHTLLAPPSGHQYKAGGSSAVVIVSKVNTPEVASLVAMSDVVGSSRRRSSFGTQPTAPLPPKKKQRASHGEGSSCSSAPLSSGVINTQETQILSNVRAPLSSTLTPRRLLLENGALLHIHLENFKSHANFSMRFGPRLNFIVGRNGTGKSSILAAMIAALGGNPNKHSGTAGGAKSAGGLIRDGASYGLVELTIANGGPDPFTFEGLAPPEAAGELTVTLRLTRSIQGGNNNKISSAYSINGKSVPLRRIKELAEFYSYEVENPCVINTQAVSASFLRDTKDAGKRYSFFLKAANLDVLKQEYYHAYEEKSLMEQRLSRHGEGKRSLELELEKARKRATAAAERVELERAITTAERRSAYAILATSRASVDVVREQGKGLSSRAAELGEAEREAKDAHRHARNAQERRNAERQEALTRLAEHAKKAGEYKKEHKAASRALREVAERQAEAQAAEKSAAAAIGEFRRRLDEQRSNLDAATRKADAVLEDKISKLTSAVSKALHEQEAARRSAEPLEDSAQRASEAAAISRRAAEEAKREHAAAKADHERLRRAASQKGGAVGHAKAALFHRDMPRLLERIGAAKGTWTDYEPVGPIGMHLAPKPEASRVFGDALEKALGGWPTLSTFVVGNHADERKLRTLCPGGLSSSLRVLVMPAERRFTPKPPGPPPALTALSSLEDIRHDVVYNALLNLNSPETCLLLESLQDVEHLVFGNGSNYTRAFTPDGTSHFKRGRTTASEPPLRRNGLQGWSSLLCGGAVSDEQTLADQSQRQACVVDAAAERAARLARAADGDAKAENAAQMALRRAREVVRAAEAKKRSADAALEAAKDERQVNPAALEMQGTHDDLDEAQRQLDAAQSATLRLKAEEERAARAMRAVQDAVEEAKAEEARLNALLANGGDGAGGEDEVEPGVDLTAVAQAAAKATQAAERARRELQTKEEEVGKMEEELRQAERAVGEQFPEGAPAGVSFRPIDEADREEEEIAAAGRRGRVGGPAGAVSSSERLARCREVAETAKRELNALVSRLRGLNNRCGGADEGMTSAAVLRERLDAAERSVQRHVELAEQCVAVHSKLSSSLKERFQVCGFDVDLTLCMPCEPASRSRHAEHKHARARPLCAA